MGWATIYRPATDELDAKLTLEQLRIGARNAGNYPWIIPCATVAICGVFSQWVPFASLAAWFFVVVAGLVAQVVMTRPLRAPIHDLSRARPMLIRTAIGLGLFVLAWTSMAVFLWAPNNTADAYMLLLVLACSMAAANSVSASNRSINLMMLGIYAAAMAFASWRQGGTAAEAFIFLTLIYTVYMLQLGATVRSNSNDMLMLMHERTELVDNLRAAKDESDRARLRAEQASQAKSQFLANMSHELRTPLNAILGFSEMIDAFAEKPEKTREYSGYIHDSGAHLLNLINDILDLAKIEAGGNVLREGEMDLTEAIADCLNLIRPRAESAGVRLIAEIGALPWLFADARALRQVLLNLLSNAVKFTPMGGEVRVFALHSEDGCIRFGVRDSGVGIAEEDLSRVFEKFGQGRHDVAVADKGTGLGLAIVKGLIEAHGGTVTLDSTVGIGTSVVAVLPGSRITATPPRRVRA